MEEFGYMLEKAWIVIEDTVRRNMDSKIHILLKTQKRDKHC